MVADSLMAPSMRQAVIHVVPIHPIIDAQQIDTSGMTADLMAAAARF